MDDCDLEKLSAAPARISPKFNRKVTEYSATVPSSVEKVKIDALTSDTGASYQIIGSGGEKTIPLTEGDVTEIKIEVTAEDGTIKNYIIAIKRLSASDAVLSSLSISGTILEPAFSLEETEYLCKVSCVDETVTISATAPDKKCEILVNENPKDVPVNLNLGETRTVVSVKSVDGKNTKEYLVHVIRKQLLWPMFITDANLAMKLECPMTLAPVYCPILVKGSDPKAVFSQPCMDMLTRRAKVNPLDETNLEPEWRSIEYDLDKEITLALTKSVYEYKGCTEETILGKMAYHASNAEQKPKAEVDTAIVTGSDWYKAEFEGSSTSTPNIKHTVKIRGWEKRLQHMASESDVDKLKKIAEASIQTYKLKLPKKIGDMAKYDDGDSPDEHLHKAGICYAAAIKSRPKDSDLHVRLGLVLEEQYYLQEIYGLEKVEHDQAAGVNLAAKESSKDEDCAAICKLRGVGLGAPLATQLKAIDEEYHHLLDNGQSQKADYVMALYVWKSKQALKGGQTGLKAADDSNPLGQAYLKYMDALAVNPNDSTNNLHAGRMMIAQGNFDEAITRLQQAVGLKPTNAVARYYLGLALISKTDGPGNRNKEALSYLHDGLEQMLLKRLEDASAKGTKSSMELFCEDPWRISNTVILRGFFTLAQCLAKSPQPGCRTATEILHCICLHASIALTTFHARNDIFKQLEWLVLDCHYSLLEMLMKEKKPNQELIAQRCNYLLAVSRNVTIPQSDDLLQLQEKVCQKLVWMQPNNSRALYLLGVAQLARYDNDPKSDFGERCLKDCRLSFHASISLEGKPAAGEAKEEISNQIWWQDCVNAAKPKNQPAEKASTPQATRGRGGSVRGAARGAPASRGRGTAPARAAPPARGRGGVGPSRSGPVGRGKGGATKPTAASSNTKCDKPEPPKVVEEPKPDVATPAPQPSKSAPPNRKTYHARLGLARALSRSENTLKDSQATYEDVIQMAPQVHDAYIELAEILIKVDPLAAVDVYCRFPRSGNEDSFDDAYLSGEIVHILMKHEKFDDARLCEHMVAYGRVMGIGMLNIYCTIKLDTYATISAIFLLSQEACRGMWNLIFLDRLHLRFHHDRDLPRLGCLNFAFRAGRIGEEQTTDTSAYR